jgi:hypothetical protein
MVSIPGRLAYRVRAFQRTQAEFPRSQPVRFRLRSPVSLACELEQDPGNGVPELLALFTMLPADGDFLKILIADAKTADDVRVECSAHADCDKRDSMPESPGFGVVRKYALPMRDMPVYASLSDREIPLGFRAKGHGLAPILVSRKDFIRRRKQGRNGGKDRANGILIEGRPFF